MMNSTDLMSDARLNLDPSRFSEDFDSEPFGFTHTLSNLGLFQPGSLLKLTDAYANHPADYFVSASAPEAGSVFFSVPQKQYRPREALERLDTEAVRILLKRPEDHDVQFRALLDQLFLQVLNLQGGLVNDRLVRLESAVFITSANSTTPFHFDPEIAFFNQIEGEKIYHVYSPATLTEAELESFYLQGAVSIGQVDLVGRDPNHEHEFRLGPGMGLHQPQNSPHWVETRGSRSVSYSFVYETNNTRARGRTRACNYYSRKFGFLPRKPGINPALDAAKSEVMRALIPLRQRMARVVRKFRGARVVSRE
jgi:Cupin superfamily protein